MFLFHVYCSVGWCMYALFMFEWRVFLLSDLKQDIINHDGLLYPTCGRRSTNDVIMLTHRLRRWPIIYIQQTQNICIMLDQRRRRWVDVVQMLCNFFLFNGYGILWHRWDTVSSWPALMAHLYRLGLVTWRYQVRIAVRPNIYRRGCAYSAPNCSKFGKVQCCL